MAWESLLDRESSMCKGPGVGGTMGVVKNLQKFGDGATEKRSSHGLQ